MQNEPSLLNSSKPKEFDFISFANKISSVIGKFSCKVRDEKIPYLSEFEQADIVIDGVIVGYIGRLNLNIEKEKDLGKTYVCEIKFNKLKFNKIVAKPYSKFPSISRDLSIISPKNMRFDEIKKCILDLKISNLKSFNLVDIYSDEKLKENQSITINFIFQDMNKTLEDGDISSQIDIILSSLKENLNIGLR